VITRRQVEQVAEESGFRPAAVGEVIRLCLRWSSADSEFLDRLYDEGEVDASILHSDPTVQRRIQTQPMLLWKVLNVRRHRQGTS